MISKEGAEEYTRKKVRLEKHIENFLEDHITVLGADIFTIGKQVRTDGKNAIDLMGRGGQNNPLIASLNYAIF